MTEQTTPTKNRPPGATQALHVQVTKPITATNPVRMERLHVLLRSDDRTRLQCGEEFESGFRDYTNRDGTPFVPEDHADPCPGCYPGLFDHSTATPTRSGEKESSPLAGKPSSIKREPYQCPDCPWTGDWPAAVGAHRAAHDRERKLKATEPEARPARRLEGYEVLLPATIGQRIKDMDSMYGETPSERVAFIIRHHFHGATQ